LKLSTVSRPEPPYSLEFFTKNNMEAGQKLTVFTICMPDPEGCEGPAIKELRLPESTLLLMIARRQKVPKLFRKAQNILNILNEHTENHGKEARELVGKAQEIILQINEKRYFHKDENEEESDIWQVLPPRGDTVLRGWDHVTILAKVGDQEKVIDEIKNRFRSYRIERSVCEENAGEGRR